MYTKVAMVYTHPNTLTIAAYDLSWNDEKRKRGVMGEGKSQQKWEDGVKLSALPREKVIIKKRIARDKGNQPIETRNTLTIAAYEWSQQSKRVQISHLHPL